jgi:hypothetical protein
LLAVFLLQVDMYHGSMVPQRSDEAADMRWAWSASPSGKREAGRRAEKSRLDQSPLHEDMLEVVRLLSTATAEVQTQEPSFTQQMRQVHTDDDGNRCIAIQAGTTARTVNASTQVNENDVAAVPETSLYDDAYEGYESALAHPQTSMASPLTTAMGNSTHRPHSDIPAEQYPGFLSDAKALGVCNRYGFISLPQPPVQLPPRRRIKAIAPVDYPHLYGTHDIHLDDGVTNRISRAHSLWVASSGFVPKF